MSKKRIEIVASADTLANLSTFKSVEGLNEAMRHYKRLFADELNKTELAGAIQLQISRRFFSTQNEVRRINRKESAAL